MDAKTITMYDEADSLGECDKFLVSKKSDEGKYDSKSVTYKTMRDGLVESSVDAVSSMFEFSGLSSLSGQVLDPLSTILYGDLEIDGTKTFKVAPLVTDSRLSDFESIPEDSVMTKRSVSKMIVDKNPYIGAKSTVGCCPRNSEGYTYDEENPNLLRWRIGAGQNDSSMFKKDDGNLAGTVKCDKDGTLVCYGWLADQGNTAPENCWVALFGKIRNEIDDQGYTQEYFTALQVQPWILGRNSQTVQYVGFTVPVKQGLELKIKTGFAVNGNPGWFGQGDSLMLASGSTINMFVGYIIQ